MTGLTSGPGAWRFEWVDSPMGSSIIVDGEATGEAVWTVNGDRWWFRRCGYKTREAAKAAAEEAWSR